VSAEVLKISVDESSKSGLNTDDAVFAKPAYALFASTSLSIAELIAFLIYEFAPNPFLLFMPM